VSQNSDTDKIVEAAPEVAAITLDQAAGAFEKDLDDAFSIINNLSKNELQRVMKKLLAHPFHDDRVDLGKGALERQIYDRGLTIAAFKMYMTLEHLKMEADKQEQGEESE